MVGRRQKSQGIDWLQNETFILSNVRETNDTRKRAVVKNMLQAAAMETC